MNIHSFKEKKDSRKKISMITCYDHWSAQLIDQTEIDCVLVGDSLAMVMHGHKTTLSASVDLMSLHCKAVVHGAPNKFIVGDMPFMSNRKGLTSSMNAVEKIMKTGVQAIKLEGAIGNTDLVNHIVHSGVPVMGHLGLTPQSIHQLGGFKVQGREEKAATLIVEHAKLLQDAGCFALVLECVPSPLAKRITQELEIPTIGIGAGPDTDGQVLVLQDMLGMNETFKPKFLKSYLDGAKLIKQALQTYHHEVVDKKFPSKLETYE